MNVAVCVITYQRPTGLQRLLDAIEEMQVSDGEVNVELVVVDNDPAGSAEELCKKAGTTSRFPLRYFLEEKRGIPAARNTAVKLALEQADAVAFIDDDEAPDAGWLSELVRVQRETGADVVTGPILPRFEQDVPKWAVSGRFFECKRYATGHRLDVAYTNNVLIQSAVLRETAPLFDERMALTGGTDAELFRRLHAEGRSIVWVDTALVYEWIPPSRTRWRWIAQRSYRVANRLGLLGLDKARSWSTRANMLAKASVWVLLGVLTLPLVVVTGRSALVKAIQRMAYGFGYIAALSGSRYEEYKHTHGG